MIRKENMFFLINSEKIDTQYDANNINHLFFMQS